LEQQGSQTFWESAETRHRLAAWIASALTEDRAREDLATRALFSGVERRARGVVTAGEAGVICGVPAMESVFAILDARCRKVSGLQDGDTVSPGAGVLEIDGPVEALLSGERTALNIGSHLSGIASRTARWLRHAPTVQLLDTRKTIPGLRHFQKHAVRVGGGTSHRAHLAEFPMVKENHRLLFRQAFLAPDADKREEISSIVEALRAAHPDLPLEVEVEDQESFLACLAEGVDIVLVDNQPADVLREWLAEAARKGHEVNPERIEASGGLAGDAIAAQAAAGAGRISSGALTHRSRALELSMDIGWLD